MRLISDVLLAGAVLLAACAAVTRIGAYAIERRNPPAGGFATIGGARMHFVHVPGPIDASLPPVVFLHGASGNLLDQMRPVRALLEGRAEMLFPDRPGHGWSERGTAAGQSLTVQAKTLAALMTHCGIGRAVIIGHSFGGALAATLAVQHPESVAGLVFLAPATHPWPGGRTSWYYDLAAAPIVGRLFVETVALPAVFVRAAAATVAVFAPNPVPPDYFRKAGIALLMRPRHFRANALDVANLYEHVRRIAPRYREIAAPTVIITGDRDGVVLEEIHAEGLARDITGARLIRLGNVGHKPDWVAPELTVAAIESVCGLAPDLQAIARSVEARMAGGEIAAAEPGPEAELAPAD